MVLDQRVNSKKKHPVRLLFQEGREVTILLQEGVSLLEGVRQEDHFIRSSCGGFASCSECVVKVCKGEENLNAPSPEEVRLLGNVFHLTKERLSCQTQVKGEAMFDLSSHQEGAPPGGKKKRPIFKVRKKGAFQKKRDQIPPSPKRPGGSRRPRLFLSPEDKEKL